MWGIVGYAQQLNTNYYNSRKFTRIKMLLTCWQRQTLSKAWSMCQACWIGCKLSCSCNLVIMWLVLHNIIFVSIIVVKCYRESDQDQRAICVVLDWLTIWRVLELKKNMIVLCWWALCGFKGIIPSSSIIKLYDEQMSCFEEVVILPSYFIKKVNTMEHIAFF